MRSTLTIAERGDPEAVTRLKDAIRGCDALLIATPEYRHSTFTDGRLVDEDARGFLRRLLANLSSWTRFARTWEPPGAQ